MMLVTTLTFLMALGAAFAGYSGSSSNDVGGGSNSYGYGYSGSYSGNGADFAPPNIPNIDFGNFLNGYFDSFRKYQEQFLNNRGPYSFAITSSSYPSSASSSSNAKVEAMSSITFTRDDRIQQQVQQLAAQNQEYAAHAAPVYTGGEGVSFTNRFKGGENGGGAVASASLGPQGGYQTAAVYPENPNAPNIFSRFGETAQGHGGPGTYSVFTSSVSSSNNQDGKPQNFHRATTTINDNGKISTYTVKNP